MCPSPAGRREISSHPPGVRPEDGLSTTPLQNWLDYPFITALPMPGLSTGCPRNFPYSQAASRAEVRPWSRYVPGGGKSLDIGPLQALWLAAAG